MFFANFLLTKKGPLAKIWLAAHWEKKLTKAQVYDTDIEKTVDYIMENTGGSRAKIRMALRTTGHLLLGVVKIYSRKTKYLLADCNDTCSRIRMAFRPFTIAVDLPDDHVMAAFDAITYPEVFHDFDSAGMDISLNQSRYEDITIPDVPAHLEAIYNSENAFGFGDDFDEIEAHRGASSSGQFVLGDMGNLRPSVNSGRKLSGLEGESGNRIDLGQFLDGDGVNDGMGAPMEVDGLNIDNANLAPDNFDAAVSPRPMGTPVPAAILENPPPSAGPRLSDIHGMTTLLSEGADGFVLPPLDEATMLESRFRGQNRKRRRCLMVDEEKEIAADKFKKQITNHKDTLRPLDLAPETKRKMVIKERDACDHLFSFPCLEIESKGILEIYQSNLNTRNCPDQTSVDIGITLPPLPADGDDIHYDDVPPPLAPIIEDVELERNQDQSDRPAAPIMDQGANNTFVEPFLPPPMPQPQRMETPGIENDAPMAFLNSVLGDSPFPNMVGENGMGEMPRQDVLMERNSSTPFLPTSTPRRSPRKEKSRLSQQDEAAEANLDGSRTSRASSTWDTKAQGILNKLKERMNWLRETPEMTFDDVVDGRDFRKSVARKFYAILELAKAQSVELKQTEPYGTIIIRGGRNFDNSMYA